MLTQEKVQAIFEYDSITGNLIRKVGISKKYPVGSIAGSLYSCGYVYLAIHSKRYLAHRVVWLWHHGEMPKGDIDHINGNRSDNRIENLRACSRSENMQNYKKPRTNKSGFIGVHFHQREKKFIAVINANSEIIRLGSFSTAEEASAAYISAKKIYHLFNPQASR